MTYIIKRALCPGCGAPLTLEDAQALVTCLYCGCDSKVERHLRRIEPELKDIPPPVSSGDPQKDLNNWSAEQLIKSLLTETDKNRLLEIAKAMDSWGHANEKMARWIPAIIETMEKYSFLDRPLAEILGKLICCDDLKIKRQVIRAGEKYGFNVNGSRGLLFALSLGDESTVKLLLDIAEYGAKLGADDYAKEALLSVQTAVGRISDREKLKICMEILLYRLFYVSGISQEWILNYLRNHFDVGYTFMYGSVLSLMDDCVYEAPELIDGLQKAIAKCSRYNDDREEFNYRLSVIKELKTKDAKYWGCKTLGYPPNDITAEDIERAVSVLLPLTEGDYLKEAALWAIRNL